MLDIATQTMTEVLARRLLGYDSLKLKGFKSGKESVMAARNHTFTGPDIEKPY